MGCSAHRDSYSNPFWAIAKISALAATSSHQRISRSMALGEDCRTVAEWWTSVSCSHSKGLNSIINYSTISSNSLIDNYEVRQICCVFSYM